MDTRGHTENTCSLINVDGVTLEKTRDLQLYRSIVVFSNNIFVIDRNVSKVLIHGLQDGGLLYKSDILESVPRAVCILNDTGIAVILNNGLIKIISTHNTPVLRWTRDLRVQEGLDSYDGVVSLKGDLVLCGVKEHTLCWCIVSGNDGHVDGTIHQICPVKKYVSSSYITGKYNIIYISFDGNYPDTGVYAYDVQNPSKYKYIYKHKDLKRPRGIVIDEHGSLFMCNYIPYPCIYHLTSECQPVSIITQGLPLPPSYPFSVCWDDGLLYVTCMHSNHFTRYKTQYPDLDVSRKGNLKAPINQTEAVFIHKKLADLAKSIGIIKTPCGSGTGFRVGPNYVMTARHVVEPIMRTAPFTQQQQPQLPFQPQLSDNNVIIDLCYEWNSLPSDPNHIYYFESEIVYESVNLDTVIVKLKPDTKAFPPPLTRFTDVTRLSQDTSHGYFIGHSQADIKKTDKYDSVTLTKSDIDNAKKWSMDFEKVDGYEGIENQQRVHFHCSFEQGASGSPGFWINPGDGQAYVELMLLCGYPKWLYNKYQGNTREIPNHFLVEQGVSMKSVYDDVKARDALLCNAVFGTKS